MEQLNMILNYYNQHKMVFVIIAIIIVLLLLFRFKSILFRLFLIALVLLGTYAFIAYFAGVASKYKETLIERHFPRERLR